MVNVVVYSAEVVSPVVCSAEMVTPVVYSNDVVALVVYSAFKVVAPVVYRCRSDSTSSILGILVQW